MSIKNLSKTRQRPSLKSWSPSMSVNDSNVLNVSNVFGKINLLSSLTSLTSLTVIVFIVHYELSLTKNRQCCMMKGETNLDSADIGELSKTSMKLKEAGSLLKPLKF